MEAGSKSMIGGSESLPPCAPTVPAGVLDY